MGFESVYNRLLKYIFYPVFERFSFPEKDRIYIIKFYLTGLTAVTLEWLENNCDEKIDDIIRVLTNCITGDFGLEKTDVEQIRRQLKWTP
jgi:hypothetical protein